MEKNFWLEMVKAIRKFVAFLTLIIASTIIELNTPEPYFKWYYWLFLFLTFCGVNWLDKVKWFTGDTTPKAPKVPADGDK